MPNRYELHDYALAYVIREEIYYQGGPGSPRESEDNHDQTGMELLWLCYGHSLIQEPDKVLQKFPWFHRFLDKTKLELWNELPEYPFYVEYEGDKCHYWENGHSVSFICNRHFLD